MNDAKTDFLVAHMQAVGSFYDNYLINGDGFYSKNIFKRFLQKLGLMKKEKLSAGEYLSLIDGNVLIHALVGNSLARGDYASGEVSTWEDNILVDAQVPLEKKVKMKSEVYALTSKGFYEIGNKSKEMNREELTRDLLNKGMNQPELTGNDLLYKAIKKK